MSFLSWLNSIPLHTGGGLGGPWRQGSLPPSLHAPCANSGGECCRAQVGFGRRVWQRVRQLSGLDCGLVAGRQAVATGQQLSDGADVFRMAGPEALQHVFGDSRPVLAKKGQVGKTRVPRPPQAKTEDSLPTDKQSQAWAAKRPW